MKLWCNVEIEIDFNKKEFERISKEEMKNYALKKGYNSDKMVQEICEKIVNNQIAQQLKGVKYEMEERRGGVDMWEIWGEFGRIGYGLPKNCEVCDVEEEIDNYVRYHKIDDALTNTKEIKKEINNILNYIEEQYCTINKTECDLLILSILDSVCATRPNPSDYKEYFHLFQVGD